MKFSFILLILLTVIFTGCEQSQSQILAQRTEFDRVIQAKDNAIAELKSENSKLQELAMKAAQSAVSPKELGETVAEIVAKRIEERNATLHGELKTRLDELSQSLKNGIQTVQQEKVPARSNTIQPALKPAESSVINNGEDRKKISPFVFPK